MEKIKNKILLLTILLLLITFISCENGGENNFPPDNEYKVSIKQGVWGNVWFWEGNFMPSTDNSSNGTIKAVVREINVHEAAPYDSVEYDMERHSFVAKVNTKLIKVISSDQDGFFQIELPIGKYSFFAKEDSLFFASITDSEGHIMSAEVFDNKVTKRQINIDYLAAY